MKSRNNDETMLLQKEKDLLNNMEKELAYQYAGINILLLYIYIAILLSNNGNNINNTYNKDQK